MTLSLSFRVFVFATYFSDLKAYLLLSSDTNSDTNRPATDGFIIANNGGQ